ncbi:hypothetical protein [Janthinobacterium fluminis]|uniref:Flagellar assembly protein T N-terminal domain-containing protein n=1 Tax=Janthinobacterium fluminis TaxID=2987524 RepID=A0ABT5K157_9BURK|nr:hypothetical protein [Janthinobacterium fluminis]MDC8758143.1 hypothetical protein [Janthinobacterium fluminis]
MKKLVLFGAGLLLSFQCFAQIVVVKGVATVSYPKELSVALKEKAYRDAQVASVERYFAESGEAESQNFEAIQEHVQASLDKFLLSTTVINELDQPSLHKYSVSVRVELNVAKLKNTLRSASATGKTAVAEKSQMVYVFVGREVASVRAYDDRVVQRAELSAEASMSRNGSVKGSEGESLKRNSVSTNASKRQNDKIEVKRSVTVETGGSTTRKADDTAYRVFSMANQKTAVTSVFSQAGFSVADPEFVLADTDVPAVNNDFSKGNDLTPATLRSIVGSLRKASVPLLVLATFDVNAPIADDATGLQRVTVSVTGRVMDLRGNLPREVASVPPVQYFGLGSDNNTATTKALKEASSAAAKEIVSRLNAVGVH